MGTSSIIDAANIKPEPEYDELPGPMIGEEDEKYVPPTRRADAPLASIINPEVEDVDPRRFFPDFKPNATLRFSRVFAAVSKPTVMNQIWWTSRTFKKSGAANVDEKPNVGRGFALQITNAPLASECATDEREVYSSYNDPSFWRSADSDEEEDATAWRFGPAQIWYDRMGVPANPRRFDYGFGVKKNVGSRKNNAKSRRDGRAGGNASPTKSRQSQSAAAADKTGQPTAAHMPSAPREEIKKSRADDPFLPVHLMHWEDDVILDSEDAKTKIVEELSVGKLPLCGWIPTPQTRTYQSFISAWEHGTFLRMFTKSTGVLPKTNDDGNVKPISTAHSIFPMTNFDLEMTNWEDDIIWDSENMTKTLEPKILTVDYEDDPRLFDMHDETSMNEEREASRALFKKDQHTKKSEIILMQVQQRQRQEEEEQLECTIAQIADKDPFNLSNDDYYHPKNTNKQYHCGNTTSVGSANNVVHHSIPAQNISQLFFPTHLSQQKLREHHRTPIARALPRDFIDRWHPVFSLTRHVRLVDEERERQKLSEGGCDVFMMRETHDLSARDSALVMIEYSEENPPLLGQPGMASKIRNYYKRKANKTVDEDMEFGETAYTHTSPFLGNLSPGQCLQAIENNMYRAPIYRHATRPTDFLLIRTKLGFFIRKCPPLFLAGQECPLHEVPQPNSKRATAFNRDYLMTFIYRLFWECEDSPRRIRMEDIRAAFPQIVESSVRKKLKQCAEFKRFADQNYWVLREDFRLPSKEEVLSMVTPEMCCAQWSMYAAEQRLRDAGFGDKYFFTPENEDTSDDEVTMEDEIKCAPWNTTKAFIASMKGKCLLDQTGVADPTGCGQGFSYVRVSSKPPKEEVPQAPKRVVTGTNADLRKLPLKEAKEICREYGLRDDELNSLSRWDIIHVIRTLSTQAAKARSDFKGMARFARGNIRVNMADLQEKYKEHCQKIFDLQNRTLSNPDEVVTDEYSTGDESETDDRTKRSHTGELRAKKTIGGLAFSSSATLTDAEKQKLEFEMEERERLDLQRMIRGEVTKAGGAMVSKGAKDAVARTHVDFFKEDKDKNGFSIVDPNTCSEHGSLLQDAATKKLKIYRTFRGADGKEWTRVEVISHPQLIEAYVRIRSTKSEEFIKVFAQNDCQFKEERRKEKRRLQDQLRRIKKSEARAEQQFFDSSPKKKKPEKEKKPPPPKPSLLKMRCSACGEVGHMKTNKYCPLYNQRQQRDNIQTVGDICPSTSSHANADVSGGVIAMEGTRLKISKKWYNQAEKAQNPALRLHIPKHFLEQKEAADDADYLPFSKKPSSIASNEKDRSKLYTALDRLNRSQNASSNLGPPPSAGYHASSSAGSIVASGRRRGTVEEADYLMGPQKSVHRRRADPRVSMASLLHEVFNELKAIEHAEHLMFPVNAKKVPDYYTIITKPMDLQQIRTNISANKYELRRQFLEDLTQILMNSHTYNGPDHIITKAAKQVLDLASLRLQENEPRLIELEKAINPLLDDDDMVGFCHILKEIVQECKNLPKSAAFHAKVDAKKFPLYNEKVKRPMDLSKIEQNIKEHRYTSTESFYRDIKQIHTNSEIYNGPTSSYTEKATEIVRMAERLIDAHCGNLRELELNIQESLNDGAGGTVDDGSTIGGGDDPITEALNLAIRDGSASRGATEPDGGEAATPRFSLGDDEFSRQTASVMPDEVSDVGWRGGATNFANADLPTDEEETRSEVGAGVLQDDLALSNDEFSGEEEADNDDDDGNSDVFQSQMHTSGQLNADLALTDSDDSIDDLLLAKRARIDDLESSF